MNTRFHYLYRDASNYKQWGEVVFTGWAPALEPRLVAALDGQEFFIADQVRLPELFFTGGPSNSDDHCFHEFDSFETTDAPAGDRYQRSIDELVQEFEHAGRSGWRVFDPRDRSLLPARKCWKAVVRKA